MAQHPFCKNEHKDSCTPWPSNYITTSRGFSISLLE